MITNNNTELTVVPDARSENVTPRRSFFKTAALAAAFCGVAFMGTSAHAATTWKVQSVWDAGTVGYDLFEEWANSMEEKSGGELIIKPYPAKSVAADNNALFEAVRNGVLQGMNPFTLYWSGKIPASVFLSSYPAGPDQPHQWDTMFYSMGMLEKTREIYKKFGLFYVGPIQHDANIIHSKKPVNSLADLEGMKGARRHGGRGVPAVWCINGEPAGFGYFPCPGEGHH